MRFHDGELDEERARNVRVGRLHHAEVTARLEAFSVLGDAVRLWASAAGVDAAAERRREKRAQAHRRALAIGTGLVLAALSVLFSAPALNRAGVESAPVSSALSSRGEAVVALAPVAVETVDFGARPGAIFLVEGAAHSETTVVWLDDASTGDSRL